MGTPIYGPHSAKNVSIWELYMAECFPYMLFYMGKVVSHMPLFSYMGAVSFLNLHLPIAKNISKASSGKYSDEHPPFIGNCK